MLHRVQIRAIFTAFNEKTLTAGRNFSAGVGFIVS